MRHGAEAGAGGAEATVEGVGGEVEGGRVFFGVRVLCYAERGGD